MVQSQNIKIEVTMKSRAGYWSHTGMTKKVAILAAPLILQNFSQTLLGVIDTFFVSKVSTEALAAVGLAGVIYFAVLMLFRGVANSSVIFVGRAFGAKENAEIGRSIWRCLNMSGWMLLPMLALPWLFGWIFAFATPPDSTTVRTLGTAYLQIRAAELPFVMFSAVAWGFFVGRGDSRTPMLLAWMMVLLNVFFDWLLVLGHLGAPALGVAGAAYASVMAKAIESLFSALILWNHRNREIYGTGNIRLSSLKELGNVLRIGMPMGLGDFLEIGSFSAFFAIIGQIGTQALAANQIALQYMHISFTAGIAVGMATSSLVAQYLGAKRSDLAEQVGYRGILLAMTGMGLIGLSYLIAPGFLLRVFTEDPVVIAAGVAILRLVALYQVFDGMGIALAGALNGAGDTTFTMLTRSILSWGFFIPLVALLVFRYNAGVAGAWFGALIYLSLIGIIYLFRFRSGRWKGIALA